MRKRYGKKRSYTGRRGRKSNRKFASSRGKRGMRTPRPGKIGYRL